MSAKTVTLTFKVAESGDGFKKIRAEVTGLQSVISSTVAEAKKLQSSFIDTAAVLTSFNSVAQSFQNLQSAIAGISEPFVSFDDAMRKANTMAGKGGEDFEKLKEQVIGLSKEVPVAREALAEGLYQVVSNGVPEDNWISYLETSARSAVGGCADLSKVVGVTSTVIKNYALGWDSAISIQDKIQLAAKNGVTSFEQLADALPRVSGNASTLGVSIDELLATFATLTGVSGNTAEVSTQLAAVFTALVKPSSEATKMAAEMGIQFDAAAIKAAGGFEQFLTKLDQSVKAYSAASGVLEQEVYGKLFGSAESLRSLIPLTGNLSEKYQANVAAMVDSTNTMQEAYATMADSASSRSQIMQNKIAAAFDGIAGYFAQFKPMMDLIAQLGLFAMGITSIATAMGRLLTVTKLTVVAKKGLMLVVKMLVPNIRGLVVSFNGLTTAQKVAAVATTTLKAAIRGLMIATGVGAIISVVSSAIDCFSSSADDASGSSENLTRSQQALKSYTEEGAAAQSRANEEYERARLEMKLNIERCAEFHGTKEEESRLVGELNEKYGDTLGFYSSVSDWYRVLTTNSELYCKQLQREAEIRNLTDKIVKGKSDYREATGKEYTDNTVSEEEAALKNVVANEPEDNEKIAQFAVDLLNDPLNTWIDVASGNDPWKKAKRNKADAQARVDLARDIAADEARLSALIKESTDAAAGFVKGSGGGSNTTMSAGDDVSKMSIGELKRAKEKYETKLQESHPGDDVEGLKKEYAAVSRALSSREVALGLRKAPKSQNKKAPRKVVEGENLTREQLRTNIELTTAKLTSDDSEEQRMLREKIKGWKDAVYQIDLATAKSQRPQSLDTLKDISEEIKYQQFLRENASGEDIAAIDQEIDRLNVLGKKMELSARVPVPVDQIESFHELNEELSVATELLDYVSTAEERMSVSNRISALQKKKEQMQSEGEPKPGDLKELNTLEELSKARQYYAKQQEKADADEYQSLQKTINAIDEKMKALQRGARVEEISTWVAELNKLTGEDFTIKLKEEGLDGIESMIRELQKMLDDKENPLTEGLREQIEALVGDLNSLASNKSLGKFSKKTTAAFEAVGELGSSFKNMGSTFEVPYLDVAGTIAQAVATLALSYSQASAESAGLGPWGWIAFTAAGLAQLMAVIASVKNVTAFADGGIAYGPTLGLFGEYAGASSNPEVVAPLNKLKTLIEPRDPAPLSGRVEFEIDGRKLRGVLQRVETLSRRS